MLTSQTYLAVANHLRLTLTHKNKHHKMREETKMNQHIILG